ncbi:helix-turn-helix transcriptional regulator [Flexivirga caeni]|uniref:YafY family transcriptional regulator n=1 Tax=Flexivirga caeni TaxID=2294115 RepID=A0A3M9MI91_9MICO|nr:YafY family protein [Flexivirga caeni]RNI25289.1 YafY family transcriptional regulator [Flexivirga caeni]
MATTTARLLQLLGLLQAQAVWSGDELADRLGVTPRSVRRDVDRLRELGYPVQSSRGLGGGYQLGAGRALPPLLLDQDEAVAVAVCLRLAAGGTVAGVGEAALRTLAKLDQVMPAAIRAHVAAVQEATVTVEYQAATVDSDALLVLARAIRERHQGRFDYTAKDGAATSRRVEPYRLIATGRRWYLMAFDLDRDDWRSFRLDRMSEVRASTFGFTPRPAPDAETFIRRSVSSGWEYEATVRVRCAIDEVRDRVGGWGTLTAVDDAHCELRVGAHDLDMLAWWLLRLPADFEVLDNEELVAAYRRLAVRAGRIADGGGEADAG